MINLVSLILFFMVTENLLLVYSGGFEHQSFVRQRRSFISFTPDICYFILVSFFAGLGTLLFIQLIDFEFLLIPYSIFLVFYSPRLLVYTKISKQDQKYSIIGGFLLMQLVYQYRLGILEASLAGICSAFGLVFVLMIFDRILERLSFEQLPRNLRALPLSFIIIGLIGLAFSALSLGFSELQLAFIEVK